MSIPFDAAMRSQFLELVNNNSLQIASLSATVANHVDKIAGT
jgi:hypothetical protein